MAGPSYLTGMHELVDTLGEWFAEHPFERQAAYTAGLVLLAWATHLLARRVLLRAMGHLIRASSTKLDDVLVDQGVLNRAALLLRNRAPNDEIHHRLDDPAEQPDDHGNAILELYDQRGAKIAPVNRIKGSHVKSEG